MALTRKRGSPSPAGIATREQLFAYAEQYDLASRQGKEADAVKKRLSPLIKEGVSAIGAKNDKGSYYLESDKFLLGSEAKASQSFNVEKAVAFLTAAGLQDCFTEVTSYEIDPAKIEAAVAEGRLTVDDVASFTDTKITYSVKVQRKSVMPEVEQSALAYAASRKT